MKDVDKVLAITEVARACSSCAEMYSVQLMVNEIILTHGTEDQKRKYLNMTLKEGKIGAFALTEPNAGSDAGSIQTFAEQDGDYFVCGKNQQGKPCFEARMVFSSVE